MTTADCPIIEYVSLSMLDFAFSPVCEYTCKGIPIVQDIDSCDNKAEWLLVAACCGFVAYRCDDHLRLAEYLMRRVDVKCLRCKRVYAKGAVMTDRYVRIEKL